VQVQRQLHPAAEMQFSGPTATGERTGLKVDSVLMNFARGRAHIHPENDEFIQFTQLVIDLSLVNVLSLDRARAERGTQSLRSKVPCDVRGPSCGLGGIL
jgi:hypothetical protein